MKTLSVGTLAHYQLSSTALAEGWKVTRASDGLVFGWSTHDVNDVIAGVTYRASQGLQPTAAHSTDTLQVDTLDVTAFLDVSTEAELAAGLWDGSTIVNFEYRHDTLPSSLGSDVLIKRVGVVGQITRQNNIFTAEIRGLAHQLTTRIGRSYTPVCPWRHATWTGSTYVSSVECGIDLTGRIHTGTITSLGAEPTREFSDSAQAQVMGYFNSGLLTFTSGPNAGVTREVRRWENKQFSLLRPFAYAAVVGNAYSAVIGDSHTYETCLGVFDNILNFGGFPHVPGQNAVYASPVSG